MKKLYTAFACLLLAPSAMAQTPITITAADMPVLGDSLRWSTAANATAVNFTQTGANQTWNYTSLTAVRQGIDLYQSALAVNPLYGTISLTAYGYKVLDSLPLGGMGGGIAITDVYTFYNKKTSPSRYVAEGFAAKVSGIPIPAAYNDEDEIYFLPLTYGNAPSTSTYLVRANIAGLGTMTQAGTRVTTVDGWGTIQTPFTTSAVPCIRVKSVVTGNDTVASPLLPGGSIALPRNMVEYKWLANGQHYPLLAITTDRTTGAEIVSSVRYRDSYRTLAVASVANSIVDFSAAVDRGTGQLRVQVPAALNRYQLDLYNLNGSKVASGNQHQAVMVSGLAGGIYLLLLSSDKGTGVIKIQL